MNPTFDASPESSGSGHTRIEHITLRSDIRLGEHLSQASPQEKMSATTKQRFSAGPFKSILVPDSWKREDKSSGDSTMTRMSPALEGEEAFLGVYDRGRRLNETTAQAFAKLLDANKDLKGVKVLLPQEIRDLRHVMGLSSVGDNQFTNTSQYPDPRAPVFNLASAQLITVNGRTVLEVQGRFVDQEKKPLNHFRGIFIQSPDRDSIKEFFLQSPTDKDFLRNELIYRKALQSIEW